MLSRRTVSQQQLSFLFVTVPAKHFALQNEHLADGVAKYCSDKI